MLRHACCGFEPVKTMLIWRRQAFLCFDGPRALEGACPLARIIDTTTDLQGVADLYSCQACQMLRDVDADHSCRRSSTALTLALHYPRQASSCLQLAAEPPPICKVWQWLTCTFAELASKGDCIHGSRPLAEEVALGILWQ